MKFKLAAAAVLLAACSVMPLSADARNLAAQCQDYAYRASYVNGDGSAAVQGAVGGAVAGAAIGAILGNGQGDSIGRGALVGGVAGTAIGIASNGQRYDRRAYNRAYANCMNDQANTGYGVGYGFRNDNRFGHGDGYNWRRRHHGAADPVGYCLSIHPSYNPNTGYYRTTSGAYLSCR